MFQHIKKTTTELLNYYADVVGVGPGVLGVGGLTVELEVVLEMMVEVEVVLSEGR